MTRAEKRALVILGIATLVFGVLGIVYYRALSKLGDRKEDHTLLLAGSEPLSDAQMISLANEVLSLDGRDIVNLESWETETGSPTTRRTVRVSADGSLTVTYRHRQTGWWWYVYLKREPGKVIGFSVHGL